METETEAWSGQCGHASVLVVVAGVVASGPGLERAGFGSALGFGRHCLARSGGAGQPHTMCCAYLLGLCELVSRSPSTKLRSRLPKRRSPPGGRPP